MRICSPAATRETEFPCGRAFPKRFRKLWEREKTCRGTHGLGNRIGTDGATPSHGRGNPASARCASRAMAAVLPALRLSTTGQSPPCPTREVPSTRLLMKTHPVPHSLPPRPRAAMTRHRPFLACTLDGPTLLFCRDRNGWTPGKHEARWHASPSDTRGATPDLRLTDRWLSFAAPRLLYFAL